MDNKKTEKKEDNHATTRDRRKFLAVYIIGLFSVALVLIALSFLTQVKADKQLNAMGIQLSQQESAAQGAKAKAEALQATLNEQNKQIKEQEKFINDYNQTFGEGIQPSQVIQIIAQKQKAMDYLWKLVKNYQLNRYITTAQILDQIAADFTVEQLADRDNGIFTGAAYDEYYTIKNEIEKMDLERE